MRSDRLKTLFRRLIKGEVKICEGYDCLRILFKISVDSVHHITFNQVILLDVRHDVIGLVRIEHPSKVFLVSLGDGVSTDFSVGGGAIFRRDGGIAFQGIKADNLSRPVIWLINAAE